MEKESFTELPFGAIKPKGWMQQHMQRDIDQGFVGHLDQLVPELILRDDIYGEDRLTRQVKTKDLGTQNAGHEWEVQFLWWNAETQSNWWDGYLRHLLLLEHPLVQSKLTDYIRAKLATADSDGYIGIYAKDLRYKHTIENGELWAQAALFRGLLAYYEASGEPAVLQAVIKAVQLTMENYPAGKSTPFKATEAYAGVGHGLTFVDVLATLNRITADRRYLDYAVFLYQDYSHHPQPEEDILPHNLMSEEYRFQGHGVHTYEHLRALTLAAFHHCNKQYYQVLEHYLAKLESVVTAAGGPIGDEWIAGRHAHHSDTGYEFCSLQELLHSYALLLQKTGDPKWADKIEWLFYNAAQGTRGPSGKSMAYCHSDNSYNVLGHLDMEHPQGEMRFKYSPAHQDVAVCCAPNAGRIYPYFVQNMWHKNSEKNAPGLVLNLFGPSQLNTDINGTKVSIEQHTHYPFEHQISLNISVERPVKFKLAIRRPGWADFALLDGKPVSERDSYITIEKVWRKSCKLVLTFVTKPQMKRHYPDHAGIHYGPLIYALPLKYQASTGKRYPLDGFVDQLFEGLEGGKKHWRMSADSEFKLVSDVKATDWNSAPKLVGELYDPGSQKMETVELVPMGSNILRKVSFLLHSN